MGALLDESTFKVSGNNAIGLKVNGQDDTVGALLDECTFEISGENAIGITNHNANTSGGKLLKFTAAIKDNVAISNSPITVGAGAYGMHVNDDFMVGDTTVTENAVYNAANGELDALCKFLNMKVNTGGKPFYSNVN